MGRIRAESLRVELARRAGMVIHLTITNNRHTMVSVRQTADGGASVRAHHMFLDAPEQVLAALAHMVRHPRSKKRGHVIDEYIRERQHLIAPKRPRTIYVSTRGRHHDLRALYDEVNREHFGGSIAAHITWGRMPRGGRRRSIRFGSYSVRQHLIRIHPLLDQAFVPRYFVRYIVFHEMLHAHLGVSENESGRRSIHPPEFKQAEQAYPDFERATAWLEEANNLSRLLHSRRKK